MNKIKSWTVLISDFLDHFDLYLYVCLAPLLGALFFPTGDGLSQALKMYGVYWGASVIAFPAGSFVFSYLAAKKTPEHALRLGVLGFSVSTCVMGLLPTYEVLGVWSAVLLVGSRICQSFFARGERVISRLYIIGPQATGEAIKWSVKYDILTLLGITLASSIASLVLKHQGMWWRVPFIIGGLVGLFVFYHRPVVKSKVNESVSLLNRPWPPAKRMMALIASTGLTYVPYALVFQFLNAFVPLVTPISGKEMMVSNTYFLIFDILILVGAGFLLKASTERTLYRLLQTIAALYMGTSILLFNCLSIWPTLFYVNIIRVVLVIGGVTYALCLMVWMRNFEKGIYQYLHIGMATTLGTLILGHGTSFLCLYFYKQTGWVGAPGVYLCVISCLGFWGNRFLYGYLHNHTVKSGNDVTGEISA
jgi:MFS family permease